MNPPNPLSDDRRILRRVHARRQSAGGGIYLVAIGGFVVLVPFAAFVVASVIGEASAMFGQIGVWFLLVYAAVGVGVWLLGQHDERV